jgi:hypothetical protein
MELPPLQGEAPRGEGSESTVMKTGALAVDGLVQAGVEQAPLNVGVSVQTPGSTDTAKPEESQVLYYKREYMPGMIAPEGQTLLRRRRPILRPSHRCR